MRPTPNQSSRCRIKTHDKFHLWIAQSDPILLFLERPDQFDRVLGDLAVVIVHQSLAEVESLQLDCLHCQFVALGTNPVEDEQGLLDCTGVAALGDAREHGDDAGDPAQLLAALPAPGEEAEHLDGARGAVGGEVGERGRGALAHRAAAVLRQLAELEERRGSLAALPRAAAAEEPRQRRDGGRVRPDGALVDVHGGQAGERRGRGRRRRAAAGHRGRERVHGTVRHEPDAGVVAVQAEVQERPGRRLVPGLRVTQQHRRVAGLQHLPPPGGAGLGQPQQRRYGRRGPSWHRRRFLPRLRPSIRRDGSRRRRGRRDGGYEAAQRVVGDERRAGRQREVGDGAGEVPPVEPALDAAALEGVAGGEDDGVRHDLQRDGA